MKIIFFIILAGLITGGILIAINLPNSLPGDLIYPIKRINENLRLAVNELSYQGRAQVFTDLSDSRLDEFRKLVDKKDNDRIPQILEEIILMQKRAMDDIEHEQSRGTNILADLSKFEVVFNKQQDTLKKLYFDVSPDSYGLMDKAIQSIQENLNRIAMLRARR